MFLTTYVHTYGHPSKAPWQHLILISITRVGITTLDPIINWSEHNQKPFDGNIGSDAYQMNETIISPNVTEILKIHYGTVSAHLCADCTYGIHPVILFLDNISRSLTPINSKLGTLFPPRPVEVPLYCKIYVIGSWKKSKMAKNKTELAIMVWKGCIFCIFFNFVHRIRIFLSAT